MTRDYKALEWRTGQTIAGKTELCIGSETWLLPTELVETILQDRETAKEVEQHQNGSVRWFEKCPWCKTLYGNTRCLPHDFDMNLMTCKRCGEAAVAYA